METKIIELTGGKWGTYTYGLRVTRKERDTLFKGLEKVILILPLDNGEVCSIDIDLKSSFWRDCHEFRGRAIGKWMKKRGDCPWTYENPPKYHAEMQGNNIRILRKIN